MCYHLLAFPSERALHFSDQCRQPFNRHQEPGLQPTPYGRQGCGCKTLVCEVFGGPLKLFILFIGGKISYHGFARLVDISSLQDRVNLLNIWLLSLTFDKAVEIGLI